MDFISDHLTELIVGIIGSLIAAGIIALISHSKKWQPVRVPIWVIVFIAGFAFVWFLYPVFQSDKPKPIVDESFVTQSVVLDGKKFIRCKFDRCKLVFRGNAPFGMEQCDIIAPKFDFEGAAGVTVFQLAKLSKDPPFSKLVQDAISGEQAPKDNKNN
jgi:hypothetical protein